jgi:hypothetical protein
MKRIAFVFLTLFFCISALNAQEPKNNLRKSLFQLKQNFPAVEFGWEENEERVFVYQDEDEYNTKDYFFTFKNDRVQSEALIVGSKGVIKNDTYMWFLQTTSSFYEKKGYQRAFVSDAILRAINSFKKSDVIIDSHDYMSEFDYSDFVLVIQYKPEERTCLLLYMVN